MIRMFLRPIAIAAAAAGAAAAQPVFEPPLAAPTPLAEPVYLELQPGWRSDCVMTMTVDNPDMPSMPEMRMSTAIEDAEGGVRVVTTESFSGGEIVTFLGDDGSVAVDDSSLGGLELSEAARAELRASIGELIPEAMLHRRTLAQGDTVFEAEEMSRLFGALLEGMPLGMSVDLAGGSVVAGESVAEGRRSLVFHTDLDLEMAFENAGQEISMTIAAEGFDAVDVETGLYRYAAYGLVLSLPPDPALPTTEIRAEMIVACDIGPGGM